MTYRSDKRNDICNITCRHIEVETCIDITLDTWRRSNWSLFPDNSTFQRVRQGHFRIIYTLRLYFSFLLGVNPLHQWVVVETRLIVFLRVRSYILVTSGKRCPKWPRKLPKKSFYFVFTQILDIYVYFSSNIIM